MHISKRHLSNEIALQRASDTDQYKQYYTKLNTAVRVPDSNVLRMPSITKLVSGKSRCTRKKYLQITRKSINESVNRALDKSVS